MIAPDKVAEVIRLTTLEKPAHATHWSTRRMAKQRGIGDTSVLRIWRVHGLKPHRSETFKVSNHPLCKPWTALSRVCRCSEAGPRP